MSRRVDRTRRASAKGCSCDDHKMQAAATLTTTPLTKLDTSLPPSLPSKHFPWNQNQLQRWLARPKMSCSQVEISRRPVYFSTLQYSTVGHEKVIMPFYHRCSQKFIHKQMALTRDVITNCKSSNRLGVVRRGVASIREGNLEINTDHFDIIGGG